MRGREGEPKKCKFSSNLDFNNLGGRVLNRDCFLFFFKKSILNSGNRLFNFRSVAFDD